MYGDPPFIRDHRDCQVSIIFDQVEVLSVQLPRRFALQLSTPIICRKAPAEKSEHLHLVSLTHSVAGMIRSFKLWRSQTRTSTHPSISK
jgi:hypothetical protein